jgi:hypothetical protein
MITIMVVTMEVQEDITDQEEVLLFMEQQAIRNLQKEKAVLGQASQVLSKRR